jgi:hypothetical protein
MEEKIQGIRQSVAAASQRLVAPKTWLGSEAVNVLQVLGEMIDLVEQMNIQLSEHVHGSSPVPNNAAAFASSALTAAMSAEKIKAVTM